MNINQADDGGTSDSLPHSDLYTSYSTTSNSLSSDHSVGGTKSDMISRVPVDDRGGHSLIVSRDRSRSPLLSPISPTCNYSTSSRSKSVHVRSTPGKNKLIQHDLIIFC